MKHITVQEFAEVLNHENTSPDVDFINVCTPEEYAAHSIPGVRNVPLDTLFGHVDELRDKKTIYVHCRSGRRSEKAIETLRALGVHGELINVSGGLMAWQEMQIKNTPSEKTPQKKRWLLFALLLLIAIILLWKGIPSSKEMTVDPSDILNPQSVVSSSPASDTLSSDEVKDILWIREEEKLARDVYQTLYDRWQVPVFSNIAQSESTHMATMGLLIEKYQLTDPVKEDTRGSFSNPEFETLYQNLVTKGNTSLEEALTVGATIEDLDIRDIEEALKRTDKEDIRNAYENLSRGSRNHIRAFNRQLTQKVGQPYTAQYISQAQLDAILSQSQETGNGGGRGRNSHQ